MIREIIQFVNHLENDFPEVFTYNRKPSTGLHFWVETDTQGQWKNNIPTANKDYAIYDGKSSPEGLTYEACLYAEQGRRIGTRMDKVLDNAKIEGSKKFQLFSCSPFIISFKKQSYPLINSRLENFFENAMNTCLNEEDETSRQIALNFKILLPEILNKIKSLETSILNKAGETEQINLLDTFKDDHYINIYLKNVPLEKYTEAHNNYLKAKLFNTDKYNSDKKAATETYGLSNYLNGANSKKPFLEHKTAAMHKGISGRITEKDALALNQFEILLGNKVLPNPLPLFVDPTEFKTQDEIIRIFNDEGEKRPSLAALLKNICNTHADWTLGNYYLLHLERGVVNDFDFVSTFQYQLDDCMIQNSFEITQKKELIPNIPIKTIFAFENIVVKKIFNNGLVKESKTGLSYNYFNDIDSNYISGGDIVANLILQYRKAFYDFIYKSRRQAITPLIFDDVMLTSIHSDVRLDEYKDRYHTKDTSIKEKLNIWFSLYNYFDNNTKNRNNMANQFKSLLKKMTLVANDDNIHFEDNVGEFLFGAGQVIYFLLSKSAAGNKTHALLEPFLQKVNAIANAVGMYKHEISFSKGRFERLSAQVLTFDTDENLKNYQRFLLAGYFAPSVVYAKTENNIETEINNK